MGFSLAGGQLFPVAAREPGVAAKWQQEVAAGSALRIAFCRPDRFAPRVACPLLVLAYEDDQTVTAGPALKAGRRAPHGQVVRLQGDRDAAFIDGFDQTVELQLAFLRRHLIDAVQRSSTAMAA